MNKKELNEMEKENCMFMIEEPEVIYTPASFSDGSKLTKIMLDNENKTLLWVTENFDPEAFIRED